MGFINGIVQWSLHKEARRMADIVSELYPKSKARYPSANEQTVIINMAFENKNLTRLPEKSRKRLEICCETVQGFCYMMALDLGRLKSMTNLRSLQFTYYMDKELDVRGFSKQSKEQKERILKAMELRIDNWDKITGD